MKNIKLILLSILFLNASCAQKDKTIVSPKINNYELVNVFEKVDIPWSIEFLDEETIVYAEKKGEIFIIKDGKSTKIQNVPEVYLRGQGGLLDLELHPNFSENKLIYMSYASGSRDAGGGNTAICRAKLIGNQLVDVKLLYKAEGNSTKGQHFGSRLQFDNNSNGSVLSADTNYVSGSFFKYCNFDDLGTVGDYNGDNYNGNIVTSVDLIFEDCEFKNLNSTSYSTAVDNRDCLVVFYNSNFLDILVKTELIFLYKLCLSL